MLPGSNESHAELLVRSNKFKNETLSNIKSDVPILVVTHSGMVNALKSDSIKENGKLNNGGHVELCSKHVIKV